MKSRPFFLILSILLSSVACANSAEPSDDLESSLHEAFKAIYLSHFGLEFPPNQEIANICYATQDESCLSTFERVMDGKRYIVSQVRADADRVLQITLDTIFRYAAIPDNGTRQTDEDLIEESTAGYGAVMALYFFDRYGQDRKIVGRMKFATPEVLRSLFRIDYEWQYNRPDPQRWIDFVEALPEKSFPASLKEEIISCFRKSDRTKFGLMLEPPSNATRSRKTVPK